MILLLYRKNIINQPCKILLTLLLLIISVLICHVPLKAEKSPADDAITLKTVDKSDLTFKLYIRDGICRSKSPIMIDIMFENRSLEPKKLCIYKFDESLFKLDLKNSMGEKINFNPKLVKAGKITKNDWVEIPPGRKYKRTFSLTRKVIAATGYRLAPSNYTLKAVYEGCSKFDPDLPDLRIESNLLYLMVTD